MPLHHHPFRSLFSPRPLAILPFDLSGCRWSQVVFSRLGLVAAFAMLPPEQSGPAVWRGSELLAEEWLVRVSAAEAAEVGDAAEAALARGELRPQRFPLPTLGPRLEAVRRALLAGRGFALLRGLPLHAWPREKTCCAFLGLGLHFGALRSQNKQGHLLGHVTDLGLSSADPGVRIYQTRERQTFHADSADVVALCCLREAQSGGDSLLCSALTVWNECLRRRRPPLTISGAR